MSAKILVLDIERQSALIDGVWDAKPQKSWIRPAQVVEPPRTICFAYKWIGEDKTRFEAEWMYPGEQDNTSVAPGGGHKVMIDKAHALLDEADYVVGYNSRYFDMGHLRTSFVAYDHLRNNPPSPWVDIDLYQQLNRVANGFFSRRLAYISEVLGLEGKEKTGGEDLWRTLRWAQGDVLRRAERKMKKYNIRDVDLTEELYYELRPWLTGLNVGLYEDDATDLVSCPNCGSGHLQYRGQAGNRTYIYRRFQCQDCGKWGRDRNSFKSVASLGIA
ncbi:DnaQ-like DNA polymerase III subunit [Mycobacterium phage Nanosmite]|nr:DnaQ-like DNA polymerase III subunit [Mycobacterium phage Nanosmite]